MSTEVFTYKAENGVSVRIEISSTKEIEWTEADRIPFILVPETILWWASLARMRTDVAIAVIDAAYETAKRLGEITAEWINDQNCSDIGQ